MACRTPGILSMVHPGLLKLCTSWLECRVLQLCTSWLECRGLQLCTWWLEGSQGIQVFDHISKCASGIPRLPPEGVKLNNRGLGHAKHSGACPDPRCGALMNSSPGGVELIRSAPTRVRDGTCACCSTPIGAGDGCCVCYPRVSPVVINVMPLRGLMAGYCNYALGGLRAACKGLYPQLLIVTGYIMFLYGL
mgnify:CR=1 FL=1